jgi:hypothetical protein
LPATTAGCERRIFDLQLDMALGLVMFAPRWSRAGEEFLFLPPLGVSSKFERILRQAISRTSLQECQLVGEKIFAGAV